MRDRLKSFLFGFLGVVVALALISLVYTGFWLRDRYGEFVVMRSIVAVVACANPQEAARFGIVCPMPVAPVGNTSPDQPVVEPPGK